MITCRWTAILDVVTGNSIVPNPHHFRRYYARSGGRPHFPEDGQFDFLQKEHKFATSGFLHYKNGISLGRFQLGFKTTLEITVTGPDKTNRPKDSALEMAIPTASVWFGINA